MALRLVMMGTGAFALPTFESLYNTDHEVVGLFTQPDRTGRGHHNHPHPMKECAIAHNTPVFQPEKANHADSLKDLQDLSPDLLVVAAYGQILSSKLLSIPRLGAINVHASLLPMYRGAAPIQYAVLNGEKETGITIFQIEPKLDAGPMLGQVKTEIGTKETSGELHDRLALLAVDLCNTVINQLEAGTQKPIIQDKMEVTLAPRLTKNSGLINWKYSAEEIGWHVRAMQPWPKAFTFWKAAESKPKRLIVVETEPSERVGDQSPGTIVATENKRLSVQTGNGVIDILRVQPEGKRAMAVSEFLSGHNVQVGQQLTSLLGD